MFDNFIDILSEYTDKFSLLGIVRAVTDLLLVVGVLIALYFLIKKRIKPKKFLLALLILLLIYLLTILFDLKMIKAIIKVFAFWMIGVFIIIYGQEIRNIWEEVFVKSKVDNAFSSAQEKQIIINRRA